MALHDHAVTGLNRSCFYGINQIQIVLQVSQRRQKNMQIEASKSTPYLQIGETKYGKPVLDGVLNHELPLNDCARLALVSLRSIVRRRWKTSIRVCVVSGYHSLTLSSNLF
jgi:hypothetical protein